MLRPPVDRGSGPRTGDVGLFLVDQILARSGGSRISPVTVIRSAEEIASRILQAVLRAAIGEMGSDQP